MQKTHLKKHARKAISVIMTTLTILSLTACGNNGTTANGNSSGSNSKNEASEQVTKTDYTISEFFSEAPYKVLYVAKAPITKDSAIDSIWVLENNKIEIFIGTGVHDYREGAELSNNPLPKEVNNLTVADITNMSDEEVVNYYRNIPNLVSGYNHVKYGDGGKDYTPHAIYDYKIHAFTDGSGNNIDSEFLVVNDTKEKTLSSIKYNPLKDGGTPGNSDDIDYSVTEEMDIKYTSSKDIIYQLIPYKNNFKIYDENFTTILKLNDDASKQLFARNSESNLFNVNKDNITCTSITIDPTRDNCAGESTKYKEDYSKYGYFIDFGNLDGITTKYTSLSDYKKHSKY
uniref:hypothetical protein n=1 Tax=Lachnospira eligens TaxID=39485 RepID=UPI00402712B5